MAYGGMVGYLMIIKGNLSYLLGVDGDNIMMKNAVLVVSSLTILFPISLQRVSQIHILSFFVLLLFQFVRTLMNTVHTFLFALLSRIWEILRRRALLV